MDESVLRFVVTDTGVDNNGIDAASIELTDPSINSEHESRDERCASMRLSRRQLRTGGAQARALAACDVS